MAIPVFKCVFYAGRAYGGEERSISTKQLCYKLDAQPAVTAVLNALNRIPPEPSSEALAKIARGIVDLIDGEVD